MMLMLRAFRLSFLFLSIYTYFHTLMAAITIFGPQYVRPASSMLARALTRFHARKMISAMPPRHYFTGMTRFFSPLPCRSYFIYR